jgi:hypothetical protein
MRQVEHVVCMGEEMHAYRGFGGKDLKKIIYTED